MKKILIVNAGYYSEITDNLVLTAQKILKKNKFNISIIKAPGVFEIPYIIRKNLKKFDAFVAIGCVIKGETPHFDIICRSSFNAIIEISVNYNKPITNGLITALNKKQAMERSGLIKSNKPNKGLEAANAVMSILRNGPKKI